MEEKRRRESGNSRENVEERRKRQEHWRKLEGGRIIMGKKEKY